MPSPEATLRRLIVRAERILPGIPAPRGKSDARWQAIMKIEEYAESHPEPIWAFALKWGKHPQEDLRTAIAVLLLEHLLEYHFLLIFPRVREAVATSKRFKDTLSRCWWLGEAAWSANAGKLDRLAGRKRFRIRPVRPQRPNCDESQVASDALDVAIR